MSVSELLLKDRIRLEKNVVIEICQKVRDIFSKLPNVIEIETEKLVIVGDIHGHDDDLIKIFQNHGLDSEYLFLGDYVDRGYEGLRVCLLLFSLIVERKCKIHCLRGNHEVTSVCLRFGFAEELSAVYGPNDGREIFGHFTDTFRMLPIAAVVNNMQFCVHGGIGKSITTIEEIQKIDRKTHSLYGEAFSGKGNRVKSYYDCEPTIMVDLLMSDPADDGKKGFKKSSRGSGYVFGEDMTERFLELNGLEKIVRSHELIQEGYTHHHDEKCITIFSCSNYCYVIGNKGATLEVHKDGRYKFHQYIATRTIKEYEENIRLDGVERSLMGNLQRKMRERQISRLGYYEQIVERQKDSNEKFNPLRYGLTWDSLLEKAKKEKENRLKKESENDVEKKKE